MAGNFLLNTSIVNFLDLLGNGKTYSVPPAQRDYSWGEEQWEDLWNDILDMRGRSDDRHYMGAVVVQTEGDREFLIIDGQQRLATLTILGLAVLASLQRLVDAGIEAGDNRERMTELRKRFIGEKDPASLVESSKLNLNHTDNGFFQDYLVQLRAPVNPRGLPKSNALLWKCFTYYCAKIGEDRDMSSKGEQLAALLSETVARQLLFILIKVDNEFNAYTVFETLNARGLELSSTDLLKNYLFSRVNAPTEKKMLERRWQSLLETVRAEHFPEFLRYHLLCEYPKIRKQRLFKIVRDRVSTVQDVFGLMDALEARAELFSALSDPHHGYWQENPDAKLPIRELKLFKSRQLTPMLFAAWEKFSPADFSRILRLASVVIFRYTVVSTLNTNALEPVSHATAKALLTGDARTPAAVFERLKPVYVDNGRFEKAFATLSITTQGQKKTLAKYILSKLETDASGRACDYETDPATIEHIFPENAPAEWDDAVSPEEGRDAVYRLGNLVLLESAINRDIGNRPYPQKVGGYQKSQYATARVLAEMAPNEWTLPLINRRQEEMAKRAAHVWRADFS